MSIDRDALARIIANHQDARMGALTEQDVTVADFELADVLIPVLSEVWDDGYSKGNLDGYFETRQETNPYAAAVR